MPRPWGWTLPKVFQPRGLEPRHPVPCPTVSPHSQESTFPSQQATLSFPHADPWAAFDHDKVSTRLQRNKKKENNGEFFMMSYLFIIKACTWIWGWGQPIFVCVITSFQLWENGDRMWQSWQIGDSPHGGTREEGTYWSSWSSPVLWFALGVLTRPSSAAGWLPHVGTLCTWPPGRWRIAPGWGRSGAESSLIILRKHKQFLLSRDPAV